MARGSNMLRLSIDPESVEATRSELEEIVRGTPIAEDAVDGFSDWQAIESMERLWAAAQPDASDVTPRERSPESET
jgi:hypothetical protein